jgi:hypothetical protein
MHACIVVAGSVQNSDRQKKGCGLSKQDHFEKLQKNRSVPVAGRQ